MSYQEFYKKSLEQPEEFWKEQSERLKWFTKPETILGKSKEGLYSWFPDGEMNTSYLCLDRHVEEGNGDRIALFYDSPVTGTKSKMTYSQLRDAVALFAGGLKSLGVEKGDRVIIYMPMIVESVIAMLACARLGAIHSVVFGGFAPHELKVRIDDATPKVILTASCGIEITKVIEYKPLVDKAISISDHKPEKVVVLTRPQADCTLGPNDIDWNDLTAGVSPAEPVPVKGNDPLYVLYTSGTTGKPKGVVRENGGHAVALHFSMDYVYGCKPGDVYWAASDIGWVVGHSYIVYAPLLYGCSTIIFEGKPVKTPDAGTFWRVIAEYGVKVFFTAPTAFRAIKKEDPNGEEYIKYDTSKLERYYLAGERLDPPTYEWLANLTGKPVLDHWWQTETGWAIVANPIKFGMAPVKSGSSTLPVPGFNIVIKDDEGNDLPANENGNIAIKFPMPPSVLNTLWNDHENFCKSYISTYDGYYLTGDGGYIDDDGYLFIMGRIDDVINVAGHRLSTGEMEELIGKHDDIAECAVVGIDDDLKGQLPVGFYITKDGTEKSDEEIEKELIALIRSEIGAVAAFKKAIQVKRLPKTRSGKILRKTIRRLASEENVPVPNTIDDPAIMQEIEDNMKDHKIGRFA